jgi:hypothetical protein
MHANVIGVHFAASLPKYDQGGQRGECRDEPRAGDPAEQAELLPEPGRLRGKC